MGRFAAVLAAGIAALLAPVAASGSVPANVRPAAPAACTADSKSAVIGGVHKCLRAGLACAPGHESEYNAYGFTCVRRRLRLLVGRRPCSSLRVGNSLCAHASSTSAPPRDPTPAPKRDR
jgi:hypothetical protein